MNGSITDPIFDLHLWNFDDAIPLIDSMRQQINHHEAHTQEMTTKISELQEQIGRLKELLKHSHAFMRRCYPRLAENELPRTLMLAIGEELWPDRKGVYNNEKLATHVFDRLNEAIGSRIYMISEHEVIEGR